MWFNSIASLCFVKELVSTFNKEEALVEAFSEYYYATLLYINVKLSNTSDHHIMAGAAVTGGSGSNGYFVVLCSASSVPQPVFTITVKAPTRAFSWLKAPASAFTFKTLSTMLNRR